jgi:hypothetical protein
MAFTLYVWSGATGAGTGADWANAMTTLAAALGAGNASTGPGTIAYVAHDHVESSGSTKAVNSWGLITNPTKAVCVNRAGSVPPVPADRRATAQVKTTGSFGMTFSGNTHFDGIIFIAGDAAGTANMDIHTTGGNWARFDNCSLRLGGSAAGNLIRAPQSTSIHGAHIELNNTTVSFANAGQSILLYDTFRWTSTPNAVLGTLPTTLFTVAAGGSQEVDCIGVDLSALTGTLVGGTSAGTWTGAGNFRFLDCKLNAAVTKAGSRRGARARRTSADVG